MYSIVQDHEREKHLSCLLCRKVMENVQDYSLCRHCWEMVMDHSFFLKSHAAKKFQSLLTALAFPSGTSGKGNHPEETCDYCKFLPDAQTFSIYRNEWHSQEKFSSLEKWE